MDDHESELVVRAADGDIAAIQSLLTRHHARLAAIIDEQVPADLQAVLAADDVCQEAYVSVYQHIGTLRDRTAAGFSSWLRAIAERKLVDAIRALRARKRGGGRVAGAGGAAADVSSVIQLLDIVALHEHTPSRSVRRRELVAGVRNAMEGMKAEYREVLRLRYVEGRSVAEAAECMGRTPGALVMLCSRALGQLAEEIGDPSRFLSWDA